MHSRGCYWPSALTYFLPVWNDLVSQFVIFLRLCAGDLVLARFFRCCWGGSEWNSLHWHRDVHPAVSQKHQRLLPQRRRRQSCRSHMCRKWVKTAWAPSYCLLSGSATNSESWPPQLLLTLYWMPSSSKRRPTWRTDPSTCWPALMKRTACPPLPPECNGPMDTAACCASPPVSWTWAALTSDPGPAERAGRGTSVTGRTEGRKAS